MTGIYNGMLDAPFISSLGNQGGLLPMGGGGGGGGTVDLVARATASRADANVNAITPQVNETVPDGVSVFGPWGQLINNTGGAINTGATDPITEASLLAAGFTAPVSGGADELTAQAGETIVPGQSVFGTFGQLANQTAGNIVLPLVPDPPTGASLLAAGLTAPISLGAEELTAQASEVIAIGQSVYGPFGHLKNETVAAITLPALPDPPTEASLLAAGLTAPDFIGAEDVTAQPSEIIQPGESVFGKFGQLINNTAGAITLSATNPPTGASLLADGLTAPIIGGADDLTAQANEVIAVNQSVYGPFGELKNETVAAITLPALPDPPTEVSLLAAGLTKPVAATGTNLTVPSAAFLDVENPTTAEVITWYNANVGSGLSINIDQSPSDLLLYTSAGSKSYVWGAGDGEAGTNAVDLLFATISDDSLEHIIVNAPLAFESGSKGVFRHYTITATTPLTTNAVNIGGTDYDAVEFTLGPSTATSEPFKLHRQSAEHILINVTGGATVNGDTSFLMQFNARGGTLSPGVAGNWFWTEG